MWQNIWIFGNYVIKTTNQSIINQSILYIHFTSSLLFKMETTNHFSQLCSYRKTNISWSKRKRSLSIQPKQSTPTRNKRRIINHTSIKSTSNVKYSEYHQPPYLSFGSRNEFVLCTNVQTSIIWFLRVLFMNGLVLIKHIILEWVEFLTLLGININV